MKTAKRKRPTRRKTAEALALDEERFWRSNEYVFHTTSGEQITPEVGFRLSTVYACVRLISENLAAMPCKVYRRTSQGRELAEDHPLYDVLHRMPNGWQTAFEWFEMMQSLILIYGNAYAHIAPGPRGAVDQLIPLHPSMMKVERLENMRLRYTYTTPSGRPIVYAQDEILHVRALSCDGVNGISPIAASPNTVGLARALENHGASLFRHGSIPGIVFSTDRPMAPKQARDITDAWNKQHGGSEHHNKPAILPFGLKPTTISLTNQDAEYIGNRKQQQLEICAIFGVPPHLVGNLDRATFSNIEQQALDFFKNTMHQWVKRWEQALRRDLIPEEEYYAEFSLEAFLRGDSAARVAFIREMIHAGIMTVNEARRLENMDPIGEAGDKHIFPSNFTTLDKIGEDPPPQANPFNEPPDDEMPEDMPDDMPEDDMPEDQAKQVLRRVVCDAVRRMAKMEMDAIERKKDDALSAWYWSHVGRLSESLRGPFEYLTGKSSFDWATDYCSQRVLQPIGVEDVELDALARINEVLNVGIHRS